MKKRSTKLALTVMAVFFSTQFPVAPVSAGDPSYSAVDGVYYSDPDVNCDDLRNAEECELFQAAASYSLRDGLSYADCTVTCDDMVESDACYSYRYSNPCMDTSVQQLLVSDN